MTTKAADEKWSPLKGGLPLAALVGGLMLARGMSRSAGAGVADAKMKHNVNRVEEANRNSQVNSTLRGGAPLDPMGSMLYQNERADSGVAGDTRMFDKEAAAIGEEAGRTLAKAAGIGGLLGKAVAGAGVVGAGMLAMKGAKKVGVIPRRNHMSAGSGVFSRNKDKIDHLVNPGGGISGEIWDLRKDLVRELGVMPGFVAEEWTNLVGLAAPGAAVLKAATATVAAIVTVLPAALLAAGLAQLAAHPRRLTFTTAGGTAADAPANVVINGTDMNGAAQ